MLYIVERIYDAKGVLKKEQRVSGDIPEAEFRHAKFCMEYLFQNKIIQYRHLVVMGGSVSYTDKKCLMVLPEEQYEVAILTA